MPLRSSAVVSIWCLQWLFYNSAARASMGPTWCYYSGRQGWARVEERRSSPQHSTSSLSEPLSALWRELVIDSGLASRDDLDDCCNIAKDDALLTSCSALLLAPSLSSVLCTRFPPSSQEWDDEAPTVTVAHHKKWEEVNKTRCHGDSSNIYACYRQRRWYW